MDVVSWYWKYLSRCCKIWNASATHGQRNVPFIRFTWEGSLSAIWLHYHKIILLFYLGNKKVQFMYLGKRMYLHVSLIELNPYVDFFHILLRYGLVLKCIKLLFPLINLHRILHNDKLKTEIPYLHKYSDPLLWDSKLSFLFPLIILEMILQLGVHLW